MTLYITGYFNADGSITFSYKWVSRLTLNSAGDILSSSVGKQFSNYNSTNTSSGTPPILTYNAATKAIESVPYNNSSISKLFY
jgi:hypothetical protein